ncbi:BTAD domain-containing putative transcriptional regulator [Nocardia sp. NPDC127526]|uniref:AfsR/SARP family transcriptional regulator n=1 Tax=Nocardia sp. NPDC127526 TaxID=3345393 RepID=UPI00363F7713
MLLQYGTMVVVGALSRSEGCGVYRSEFKESVFEMCNDGARVDIGVLGSLAVTVGGMAANIQSRRMQTIVALLALESGTVVSYEQLAAELWPAKVPSNPRNALQANVTRIRRLISPLPDLIRTTRGGYVMDVPRECLDSNRFLTLLSTASKYVKIEPAQAILLLERALGLWRGDALSGVRESPRCSSEAAYLEERRIAAWNDLESARLVVGDEWQAVAELRKLVRTYPRQERLVELFMLALYRVGRQSEALDVYHRARRLLVENQGVQPGPALERMYAGILEHNPPDDWFCSAA